MRSPPDADRPGRTPADHSTLDANRKVERQSTGRVAPSTGMSVLLGCAATVEGIELCAEASLRYDACTRDEAAGLDVTELRGKARQVVEVHLTEQAMREPLT